MTAPDPLVIAWRGQQLRVRKNDPHLGPYTPRGATLRAAIGLASDVEGFRLVLLTAVRVSDDGRVVALWRRG